MKFRIKTSLSYDVYTPTNCVVNIQALSSTKFQKIITESLQITPDLPFKQFSITGSKIRFISLVAKEFVPFKIFYEADVEVKYKAIKKDILAINTPLFDLNFKVLPYLSPSRMCPSDKLTKLAFKLFGHLPTNLEKVVAIDDWVFNNVDYISGVTNASTSAYDTLNQREGVCKDFAHLGIALCRALNIPARYFTCYATNIVPPDIHACFEAHLGGHWILFDPTRLANLKSVVKIAHGKDGSEVAVANIYGSASCTYMKIECESLDEDLTPFDLSGDFLISY